MWASCRAPCSAAVATGDGKAGVTVATAFSPILPWLPDGTHTIRETRHETGSSQSLTLPLALAVVGSTTTVRGMWCFFT